MPTSRRSFLVSLSAMPLLGWLAPKAKAAPVRPLAYKPFATISTPPYKYSVSAATWGKCSASTGGHYYLVDDAAHAKWLTMTPAEHATTFCPGLTYGWDGVRWWGSGQYADLLGY